MREIRQSGSEGGARLNPLSLPLSLIAGISTIGGISAVWVDWVGSRFGNLRYGRLGGLRYGVRCLLS